MRPLTRRINGCSSLISRLISGHCCKLSEFSMSRIRIEDLPLEETLPDNELRQIFGAGLSDRSIQATRHLFADRSRKQSRATDELIGESPVAPRNPFLVDRDSPLL